MKEYIVEYETEQIENSTFFYGGKIKRKLIRCKDCIHNVANRETDPMDITDYSGQDIVCDYFMTDGQEPDDYCSKAEPKERTGEQ